MRITDKIHAYNVDCMEFMKDKPDDYYGLAIVDVPYGIGEDGSKNHTRDRKANPGDKILDTHGGSMSIGIACHDYGFELDICELDKDYFKAGTTRLKNHVAQQRLF